MLDDLSVITNKDPSGALNMAFTSPAQLTFPAKLENPEHDGRKIDNIVIAGMGGSALAGLMMQTLVSKDIKLPFYVSRNYSAPSFVGKNSLFIASSYSGNTEETLSALDEAKKAGAQIAIISAGGKLIEIAKDHDIAYVLLPSGFQPRLAVNYNFRALSVILYNFGLLSETWLKELSEASIWLEKKASTWLPSEATENNLAKKLAFLTSGKTPIFYGGELTSSIAYKFKIGWNENAKNVAFFNEYPEVSHNEFLGWSSHPVEKPFAVFDIVSSFENPRVLKRFELTDKLLSGKRPKAVVIELKGDSLLKQLLWGSLLADVSSIYAGILNGVDPTTVDLIEKLKNELK